MSNDVVISVENLSKRYRLGQIGVTSLRESAEHWWHKLRGRNPHDHMGEIGVASRTTDHGLHQPAPDQAGGPAGTANSRDFAADLNGLNDSPAKGRPACGGNDLNESQYMWALKDVSFEVKKGEVLGIIGKNGAGKSTLLKILSRITEPTSGRAIMRGRVGSLLEVGTGFHPELTGRENVFLNGAILGMKRLEVAFKFDEIVAFSEVDKFIDTPVKRYSSGMYVRLAFAVAAHLEPEILVVDEVLAVGDVAFQKKCLGKMGDAAKEGRTVLFVSHNMASIRQICSTGILLKAGGIVGYGSSESVVDAYLMESTNVETMMSWPGGTANPEVDEFKLLRIYLESNGILDTGKENDVLLEYEIVKPVSGCRVGIRISTLSEIDVFTSYDIDVNGGLSDRRMPGFYKARIRIPANLMNEGLYSLSVVAGIFGVRNFLSLDRVLALNFHDVSGRHKFSREKRKGVIFPEIRWETEEFFRSHV